MNSLQVLPCHYAEKLLLLANSARTHLVAHAQSLSRLLVLLLLSVQVREFSLLLIWYIVNVLSVCDHIVPGELAHRVGGVPFECLKERFLNNCGIKVLFVGLQLDESAEFLDHLIFVVAPGEDGSGLGSHDLSVVHKSFKVSLINLIRVVYSTLNKQ